MRGNAFQRLAPLLLAGLPVRYLLPAVCAGRWCGRHGDALSISTTSQVIPHLDATSGNFVFTTGRGHAPAEGTGSAARIRPDRRSKTTRESGTDSYGSKTNLKPMNETLKSPETIDSSADPLTIIGSLGH